MPDRSVAAPIPQQRLLRTLQNPLLRNGHLLTLSSGLSALIGLGYWVLTARTYDPATVGRNYAAISMMMFLATFAQLDLSSAMVRFVPAAGRHTTRLVACSYLVAGSLAIGVSAGFLALVRQVAPGLAFLHDSPLFAGGFVCATLVYTIFVLQDSVLTGLRRAAWVPLENSVFAGVKVALVVVLAATMPAYGIFASWTLALIGTVLVINFALFRWAIPSHQRRDSGRSSLPPLRLIGRFVALDYVGTLCSIAAITMLPILVINLTGPEQGAYFSVAWVIAFALHLLNINMGSSLVVETSLDQSQLAERCRQVLTHTCALLVPAIGVLIVLAPALLGLFGPPYQSASGALRLLALASVPHLVVSTAISSARAQRRMAVVAVALGALPVLTLAVGAFSVPAMGPAGAALAWLLAQSLIAGVLLIRRDLWLTTGQRTATTRLRESRLRESRLRESRFRESRFRESRFRESRFRESQPWMSVLVRVGTALGFSRWVGGWRRRWHQRQARNELAALLPGLLPTLPALAGHPDPSTWTAAYPTPTVSDVTVAVLAPAQGPPAAVLKIAHRPETALELRAQHEALAALGADPRLADPRREGWRDLLPRVIEFREQEDRSWALETYLPGTTLAALLSRQPERLERLMIGVLASIAQLHQQTGDSELVQPGHLRRWVDEPLDSLREMCLAVHPSSLWLVERLGETLHGALRDRRVRVAWTHGDFTPGNVLLAGDGERVSGIVDWGGARPGQLAVLDSYHMLLTALCQAQRRELGAIVAQLVCAGGLPQHLRHLLAQTCPAAPGDPPHDMLDERAVILLSWLHHLAELRRKSHVYREHRVWWALNAEPVLRAFAAQEPDVAAGQPGRTDCDGSPVTLSVSVVICAYTEGRWVDLVNAVASVRQQTEPPAEIIVVIDHCPALLRRASGEIDGVLVVPNQHRQGLSGARNTGLELATGDVVAFLDDDAAAAPDWIARLLAGYADPQVIGVGGRVRPHWHQERPAWFPTEFDWVVGCSYRGLPTSRSPVRNFIGANMSFRRELVAALGGFHPGLGRVGAHPLGCEETELCIRIKRRHAGCVLLYEPAAQVWHSVPGSRGSWSYFRSRCYAEGLSKAAVSRLAGAEQALSSERSYLTRTITSGIIHSLAQVLRGRVSGIATAAAIMAGVTMTVLGYAAGKVQRSGQRW